MPNNFRSFTTFAGSAASKKGSEPSKSARHCMAQRRGMHHLPTANFDILEAFFFFLFRPSSLSFSMWNPGKQPGRTCSYASLTVRMSQPSQNEC